MVIPFLSATEQASLEQLIQHARKKIPSQHFPRKSVNSIRKSIKEAEKRKTLRNNLQSNIDQIASMALKYGFSECLETGQFAPWPHEVSRELECLTLGGVMFLCAKERKLDPHLYLVDGLRDSLDPDDAKSMQNEHIFIDVDAKKTLRYLIDIQLSMRGFVKYDLERKLMRVKDNNRTGKTIRYFDNLTQLTEEEYVNKINFLRTPPGAIRMLEEGQIINRNIVGKRFTIHGIKYNTTSNYLESHIVIPTPLAAKRIIVSDIDYAQSGDVRCKHIRFSTAKDMGWFQYQKQIPFGEFNASSISALWLLFEHILTRKDKKVSRHKTLKDLALQKFIQNYGISNRFEITNNMLQLEQIVSKDSLTMLMATINKEIKEQYSALKYNSALHNVLQTVATYNLASQQNNGEFLFTKEKRNKYLMDYIEAVKTSGQETHNAMCQSMMQKCHIKSGRADHLAIYLRKKRDCAKNIDEATSLIYLSERFREEYDRLADRKYFYDLKKADKLPKKWNHLKPTHTDLFNAYKELIFMFVVNSYAVKDELTIKKYQATLSSKFYGWQAYQFIEHQLNNIKIKFGEETHNISASLLDVSGEIPKNALRAYMYKLQTALIASPI